MHAIVIAILLAIAGCAGPRPAPPAPTSYIASEHLDAAVFLGPPPEPRSPQQAADLAAVQAWQHPKGTPRWTVAQHDDDITPFAAFGPVFGPAFVQRSAPKTGALFDVLFRDVRSLTAPAKEASADRALPSSIPPSRPAPRSSRRTTMPDGSIRNDDCPDPATRMPCDHI